MFFRILTLDICTEELMSCKISAKCLVTKSVTDIPNLSTASCQALGCQSTNNTYNNNYKQHK